MLTPRDFLLSRIISGLIHLTYGDKVYFYSHPSPKMLYKANVLEQEIIKNGLMVQTKNDAIDLCILRKKWSEEERIELEETIPKILEELKLKVYLSYINEKDEVDPTKEKISKVKKRLYELLTAKHKFDEYTIEGIAQKQKNIFLISNCTEDLDIDPELLLPSFYNSTLTDTQIRELARSDEWVVKWQAMKKGCQLFDGHLTEEQEYLVRWSITYDNLLEYEEPPTQEVLNDDDALDGYIIFRRMKNGSADKITQIEQKYAKKGIKYNELYLPAKDIEEAKRHNMHNSPEALKIKKARFEKIQQEGIVLERDMPDRKQSIQFEKNQHY